MTSLAVCVGVRVRPFNERERNLGSLSAVEIHDPSIAKGCITVYEGDA